MYTEATPVARTAQEREDTLHELANIQDALSKAMRHASKLADSAHPLIADIWRNLERAQRYIADAQGDVRVDPYIAEVEDAA